MSTSNQNKVTRQVRIGQFITGIQKYFSTLPEIPLGGTRYTPAALVARLQSGLDAIKQSSNAKAAWLAVVQTERNLLAELGPVLRYIKAFVIAQFGDTQDSSQKLEDFGLSYRKARSKNVAVKAEAAKQGQATRVARSTKGKKQKAKIKGTVAAAPSKDGSTTAGSAPAASTAPAPVKPVS
jgi:hypothetical protein